MIQIHGRGIATPDHARPRPAALGDARRICPAPAPHAGPTAPELAVGYLLMLAREAVCWRWLRELGARGRLRGAAPGGGSWSCLLRLLALSLGVSFLELSPGR